ncbi:unnamed protein product, partial [Polarella glacialis]
EHLDEPKPSLDSEGVRDTQFVPLRCSLDSSERFRHAPGSVGAPRSGGSRRPSGNHTAFPGAGGAASKVQRGMLSPRRCAAAEVGSITPPLSPTRRMEGVGRFNSTPLSPGRSVAE